MVHRLSLVTLLCAAQTAWAAGPEPAAADLKIDVDVVAERLDRARQQIQPSLGASSYTFSPGAVDAIPQGENAPLNQVLLRAPGVVQDSFGQIHVRGEHANLQFRLNGVQLPEGLSVFGQVIAERFARSLTLITGALPAQYGFQTAGIVDIETKTGVTNPGLSVSLYGGSWGWLQPALEYGGRSGPLDYFLVLDGLRHDRGIENPTARFGAIHDTTDQFHGLAYLYGIVDESTRVSLILGGFSGAFQIPNNPGQKILTNPGPPSTNLTVRSLSDFNSAALNERQNEATGFAVLSLQKQIGPIDAQVSIFNRTSTLRFKPDWTGDLLFNGIAQRAARENVATGLQGDGSWRVTGHYTIRAGFLAQMETVRASTRSSVLPVDAGGNQTSDQPRTAIDKSRRTGGLYGAYVQDEWRLLPAVTLNYGVRADMVDQFTNESQISPRVNLVWKPFEGTTAHIGYARYFVPPPFEAVTPASIASLLGTTGAPQGTRNGTVHAERSHYFDVGISQAVVPGLTLGIDGYFKRSTNLLDEGQFGAPIILTAFNYARGLQQGIELTASYDRGPLSMYANAAWSRAVGKDINSAQFNFDPGDLAFIRGNFIHLDHDQTWTGSAGVSYIFGQDSIHPTRISGDLVVQSGLRATIPGGVPNGTSLPMYATANMSIIQSVSARARIRLDVLNIADNVYQIRDGSGVGVGASQYGIRRTVLAGVTYKF